MDFCNSITIYKDRRKGRGGRGSEVKLLHLGGKGIIKFYYISTEGYEKG